MLSQLLESWGSVYANHAALRSGIEFMHIGGLLAGGGCAVTADLATIRAAREGLAARTIHLQLLKRTHRLIVSGLAALATSGVLLFAADVGTFLHSRVFWLKMGLVVLLIVNGSLLLVGERHVQRDASRGWTWLHYTAVSSLLLWFLTALAGVTLTNIG